MLQYPNSMSLWAPLCFDLLIKDNDVDIAELITIFFYKQSKI